ncbi:hypothetical protein N9R79_09935 [Vibrio sp.]|nr:hypothetical protein [Vibrio sp.]
MEQFKRRIKSIEDFSNLKRQGASMHVLCVLNACEATHLESKEKLFDTYINTEQQVYIARHHITELMQSMVSVSNVKHAFIYLFEGGFLDRVVVHKNTLEIVDSNEFSGRSVTMYYRCSQKAKLLFSQI